jgi:hypothetical protein
MRDRPPAVGLSGQGAVVVLGLSGDLDAQPWRAIDALAVIAKLDLSDHEPLVVSTEHVNLPHVVAPRHDVTVFADQR